MVRESWPSSIREDFPALQNRLNGKPPIYLDNACTTLVPRPVIAAMNEYYCDFPACGGERSRHWFATEVHHRIAGNPDNKTLGSRAILQDFLHARSDREIIFTLNTTHAINLVALGFPFHSGDAVLLTDKEHNSNLLPWLRLQKQGLIRVDYLDPDADDSFDLAGFEQRLKQGDVRLVSVAYTSNVTGYTIPAKEIVAIAHRHGARVLLDAAQTLPHRTVDVQDLDVDFLAFSLHKMCGPKGVGVLYGKGELLGQARREERAAATVLEPVILGGGTVGDATYGSYDLLRSPDRFEAGIQNYPAQIGAGAAIRYLQQVGFERIRAHQHRLNCFLTERLLERYGDTGWFQILGPADPAHREGILTFEVHRPNAVGIAEELSRKNNVMIRDGVFCAHAYLNRRFGQGWAYPRAPHEHRMTYRISLYFYNTPEECETLLETLDEIFRERSYI
jgi:cysteine desulfurase/selenocysteine lyase